MEEIFSLLETHYELKVPAEKRELFERAFIHPSLETKLGNSNSQLEFLGDRVIGLVLSEEFYTVYPDASSGDLTNILSANVNNYQLFKYWEPLGIDPRKHLRYDEGQAYIKVNEHTLSSTFEAFVAAIYLSSDLATVKRILLPIYRKVKIESIEGAYTNKLQEYYQKKHLPLPVYEYSTSPEGFYCSITTHSGDKLAASFAKNKRTAKQLAAKEAYLNILIFE